MRVDGRKGQLIGEFGMHRHEYLAGGDRGGNEGLHHNAGALGRNSKFVSVRNPKTSGVSRIDLKVRFGPGELPEHWRFPGPREGMPLGGTAATGKENEREVALVGWFLGSIKDEASFAIGMVILTTLEKAALGRGIDDVFSERPLHTAGSIHGGIVFDP